MLFAIDAFDRQDRVALIEAGTGRSWTYRDLAEEVERRTHQNVKEDAFASRTFTDQVPGVLARFIAEPIEATDNTRTMGWLSAETVFAFLDKGIKS